MSELQDNVLDDQNSDYTDLESLLAVANSSEFSVSDGFTKEKQEFEKLKTKVASQKKSMKQSVKSSAAPPATTLTSVPSTASMSSQKNRTFLNIDSILYPKESKKEPATQKKSRRQGLKSDPMAAGQKDN